MLAPSLNGGTFFSYVTLMMQQITVSSHLIPLSYLNADPCASQGMYPTAVIALVALRKSALEHHFTFASDSASLRSPGGLSPGGAGEDSLLPFRAPHLPRHGRYTDTVDTDMTASGFDKPAGGGGEKRVVTLRAPTRSMSTGMESCAEETELKEGLAWEGTPETPVRESSSFAQHGATVGEAR